MQDIGGNSAGKLLMTQPDVYGMKISDKAVAQVVILSVELIRVVA